MELIDQGIFCNKLYFFGGISIEICVNTTRDYLRTPFRLGDFEGITCDLGLLDFFYLCDSRSKNEYNRNMNRKAQKTGQEYEPKTLENFSDRPFAYAASNKKTYQSKTVSALETRILSKMAPKKKG